MSHHPTPAHCRRAGRPDRTSRWLLAGLLLSLPVSAARAAEPAPPLRVCMDPDNPPFSSTKAKAPGLYVELGQHIADKLGRPFEPVWTLSYFGKRSVRTTLLDRKCDAYIGLPETKESMGPRVVFSHPIVQLGYALVLPKTRTVSTLSDLEGLRVAVQFGSPPQSLIAEHDDIQAVTVLEAAKAMQDLNAGAADVAFVWGPTAGYINETDLHGVYRVAPAAGPGMQWQAAIGFPSAQTALRDQVDAAVDASADFIAALKKKYGLPSGSDGTVTLSSAESGPPAMQATPAAATGDAAPDSPPAQPAAASVGAVLPAGDAIAGQKIFNETCSHSHGPDAVQAEHHIDLRRLHLRYGDRMDEVFTYTVHHGRSDKGMPNWSGILSEDDFDEIKAFLHSVQTPSS